jgi:hypothetical protein
VAGDPPCVGCRARGTRRRKLPFLSPFLAVDWVPVIGIACALSVAGLVLIVVAPWKRVRREPPLDEEVETRLLLGEDPAVIDRDLEARNAGRAPVAELRPDER